jgi:hypothetical protein
MESGLGWLLRRTMPVVIGSWSLKVTSKVTCVSESAGCMEWGQYWWAGQGKKSWLSSGSQSSVMIWSLHHFTFLGLGILWLANWVGLNVYLWVLRMKLHPNNPELAGTLHYPNAPLLNTNNPDHISIRQHPSYVKTKNNHSWTQALAVPQNAKCPSSQ